MRRSGGSSALARTIISRAAPATVGRKKERESRKTSPPAPLRKRRGVSAGFAIPELLALSASAQVGRGLGGGRAEPGQRISLRSSGCPGRRRCPFLFENDELNASILLAHLLRDVWNERFVLTVAPRHEPVGLRAVLNEPCPHRFGALFAQDHVVVGGSAVVR